MDMRCGITSGGREPRESATENKPPRLLPGTVRVKRCGKSAPRLRQRRRQGKPHREQDRIGTATRAVRRKTKTPQGHVRPDRPGRLLEAMCKHCPRGMAVTYLLRKRAVPYRTRLTGRLMRKMRGRARPAGPLASFARAPDAAQRVALAERCAAEPGPHQTQNVMAGLDPAIHLLRKTL